MTQTGINRRAYLREVVVSAQRTGETVAPWRHLGDTDAFEGESEGESESELLAELHREWVRVLVSRLHRHGIVAERTPTSVRALYAEACEDHPTLRRILESHATASALSGPTRREHAMLARVAGLATEDGPVDEAAAAGRALLATRLPGQRLVRRRLLPPDGRQGGHRLSGTTATA